MNLFSLDLQAILRTNMVDDIELRAVGRSRDKYSSNSPEKHTIAGVQFETPVPQSPSRVTPVLFGTPTCISGAIILEKRTVTDCEES
jgi:hypothetical protein